MKKDSSIYAETDVFRLATENTSVSKLRDSRAPIVDRRAVLFVGYAGLSALRTLDSRDSEQSVYTNLCVFIF